MALLGAALDPAPFSEIRVEKGVQSLNNFPERPVQVVQRFDSSDSGD